MDAFTIRDLSFVYPRQSVPALDRLSLDIPQGAFMVLCGPSGCGKSTLLRQLKTVLAPHGRRSGQLLFEGRALEELDQRTQSQRIGFVQQSPENQLVTDKVWHELAFGLESLGLDTPTIRRRVAEMASFFGIQGWFYRDVAQLSGGQKQLLNLAAVMVMQPSALILDEPTSQLDPIAAADFLSVLGKLNRELGTTILLTEHRLEEALPLASHAAVMDRGRILASGAPHQVGRALKEAGSELFLSMPTAMRVWAGCGGGGECPITVGEGREWLGAFARTHALFPLPPERDPAPAGPVVLEAREVWFRYEKDGPDAVKDLSLQLRRGELLALLGGNGAGKTTALKLAAGLLKPYRGRVALSGRVGVLPQDPKTLFVKKTLEEDLFEVLLQGRETLPEEERRRRVTQTVSLCRLEGLLDRHPYDLSGGEQQRAALAKVLLLQPDVLLLDEPTKGLDGAFKRSLAQILDRLARGGTAILLVSHDIEFCAQYAHRCALFFDGGVVTQGPPRAFFSGNSFYTTAANRMARDLVPQAVTAQDLIAVCGGEASPPPPEETPPPAGGPGPELPPIPPAAPKKRPKASRRALLASVAVLLLIPLTLLFGVFCLEGRKYYFILLLVLLETMLPFFLLFEGRRPQAREVVILAVLCAIGVAGRGAFFMLPQFKPVIALTVVAGVAFGGQAGFLVGSMTMLASNALFSQGPWTPWQMFSMGLIGFLAGVLFRPGALPRRRGVLALFGALSAVLIYGGIMNPASALMWTHELDWKLLLAYYASGLPMDCVQAAATAFFLWFAALPMLEKLDRVKVKYGLVE